MHSRLSILVAALSISAFGGAFQNGSFEQNSCGDLPRGWSTIGTGSTCATGWTVFTDNNVDFMTGFWMGHDGKNSVDLNGNHGAGGIQQTFDVLADHNYQITFWLSGNFGGDKAFNPSGKDVGGAVVDPTKILYVSVLAGSPQTFQFNTTNNSPTNMNWVQKSLTFSTQNATSATLKFLSGSNNLDFGPVIDSISVSDLGTASPEPSTLLLLGPALGALAFYRRRRK
jgi:choice-of-anchor C domain-containing protein